VTPPGQAPIQPFSFEEIHKVILLFAQDPQAAQFARSLFAELAPVRETESRPPSDASDLLAYSGIRGTNFSGDILPLLSLLSVETNQKVEEFMKSAAFGPPMNETERAQWIARREELRNTDEVKKWLRSVSGPEIR
jgi:hypothetical protein